MSDEDGVRQPDDQDLDNTEFRQLEDLSNEDDRQPDKDLSNEEFRQLALDSQLAGDVIAGQELTRYLLRKIRRMVATFPPSDQDAATWKLIDAGARAAKATVTSAVYVESPRNYTMRAMTNAMRSLHRKAAREQAKGELLWDYNYNPQADRGASHPLRAFEVRSLIVRFLEESSTEQDKRIAEVLLMFHLDHCEDLREACEALHYTENEIKATLKKIQRDRRNPRTRLYKLIQDLRGNENHGES